MCAIERRKTMATLEQPYLDLLNKIMTEGHDKEDRTGTGTRSLFGAQMRFNLSDGFPILTTKRVPFGLIKSELLWFLRGDTNIRFLLEHNNHIWDEGHLRIGLKVMNIMALI